MAAYKHTNSKGVTYYLNSKNVVLRGGKEQTIYYFSKDERADTATDLPEGFTVNENPRNGFLTVKRK
jgi:YHS domain-containing protein